MTKIKRARAPKVFRSIAGKVATWGARQPQKKKQMAKPQRPLWMPIQRQPSRQSVWRAPIQRQQPMRQQPMARSRPTWWSISLP